VFSFEFTIKCLSQMLGNYVTVSGFTAEMVNWIRGLEFLR